MKDKIIINSVYIPVIGIFIGIALIGTEYGKRILNEPRAVMRMMICHLLIPELVVALYLIIFKFL